MVNPMRSVSKGVTHVRKGSALLVGTVIAMIWLMAGALLLSLMLRYSGLQETSLQLYAWILHSLSALAGGFAAGRKSESKGWYQGAVTGGIYAILIIVTGFLAANAPFTTETFMLLAAAVPAGAVGGMFGVGTKNN
ncbi:TIGR04086 family membrane protein [Paenibacillus sambharensis]|uniref:TIGR04086 family membrane protein n=1 Tax=Paenibacillus sambharensis TaxID=1803190 RepID=A0A2W1L7M7_9BACL|nr:TIGR04086 family membrane protein [Paenibacillus sambharensis]PZD94150.1 TIGR04086 family membrane protein [Paenibacillus sambharensis]